MYSAGSLPFAVQVGRITMRLHFLLFTLCCVSGDRHGRAPCEFPESMRGEWFQKSYHDPIIITRISLSKHGQCRERRHDKFLLYNTRDNTYSFVVITQKHPNVMQYKETPVPLRGTWTLDRAYAEIGGDTPLYSLFRVDGRPVPCPFRETFLFSYNRGSGNCSSPPSVSDSCTDKNRVLFNYKACYETSSESRKETLTCVGTWKDGSQHFLVGKVDHTGVHSNEDRFRCFLYEERRRSGGLIEGYNVAISGDATCDGLQSPNEGSTTLVLTRSPRSKTSFPSWMCHETHIWLTLDRSRSYEISSSNLSLTIQSGSWVEQRWTCEDVYEVGENQARIIVHTIEGCNSGYICLLVYRRANTVLELQVGERASRTEDACLQTYFDPTDRDYITLLAEPAGLGEAPVQGNFALVARNAALLDELLREPRPPTASPVEALNYDNRRYQHHQRQQQEKLHQQMEAALQHPDGVTDSDEHQQDEGELHCSEQMALFSACGDNMSRFELRAECAYEGQPRRTFGKEMAVQATWELTDEEGSTTYFVVSHRESVERATGRQGGGLLRAPVEYVFDGALNSPLSSPARSSSSSAAAAATDAGSPPVDVGEQRFCLALTGDRRRLFVLGETTCSRRRVGAASSKLDLYREAECPPAGVSHASPPPLHVALLCVGVALALLRYRGEPFGGVGARWGQRQLLLPPPRAQIF